jgi:hypothetical protein
MAETAKLNNVQKKTNNVITLLNTLKPNNVIPPNGSTVASKYRNALVDYRNLLVKLKNSKLVSEMNINSAKNAIAKKYKISVNSLNALLSTTVANNANNDTKKDIVLRAIQIIKSTKNETVNIKNLSELESWIADPNIKKFNTAIKPILEKIFNIPEIVLFLNESTSNNNIATFGASKNEGFEVARVPPGAVNKQVFYKILLPFTEPPKKELDIFMLGVTGSGKTTLVDSLYQYVTNVKIDRKIGGVFRAQKVSVFKPVFNVFMDNQNKTRILISENYSERDTTYDNYVKNFIRPTPFNPESSRAHVVYTLPPMRGGNTLLKGPLGKGVSTLNIVDLCGNESPIAMSMACFGMNIFEHMGTPVSYLQTISGTKILTGLNDLTQYIIKPFNKRKQSDEDKIVKNVLNDLKKIPDDRIKTMFNQIKPETIFEIFVMINLCKFIKAKPDDEFTRMMQTPNAKIARLNPPDVVKKFIADTPQIKEYSVAKYMFEMSKRCFEGLYITRSLEELKTVFNPRDFASVKNIVNKNDATLEILKNMNEKNNFKGYSIALNNLKKQINVSKTLVINSIESTKLSEVFRSKKSKKFLFAVVNPKRGNMNKHKKTINVIRRIKNIKKNISK